MCLKWYEDLYINYGDSYENEPYVQGTKGEVDFIEREINFNIESKILDIGCGTGRHSIELANRGYNVVGIDLSKSMIEKARSKAKSKDLDINFIEKNALDLDYENTFDLSLIICEGAFCLMENDEKDYQILKNAYNSLKKDGKLIMTVLNAYKQIIEGNENYDLLSSREKFTLKVNNDDNIEKEINGEQRYYIPSEIKWRLKMIGFKNIEIFGCSLGNFNRNDKFKKDNMEFLVIAKKE